MLSSGPMVEDAVPLDALRRALVIKLRHHGDVLLASPVFLWRLYRLGAIR